MTDYTFGPTGQLVYERTYSRKKPDGTNETWPETVVRVVDGNLNLNTQHHLHGERERLIELMTSFKILPAGRHLWASGVKGRQYLYNCFVSGWWDKPSDHFEFTFKKLMQGGGVGANYSNSHLEAYGVVQRQHVVHIVCDPAHPDYQAMVDEGLISTAYDADWDGAFEVEDSREGWSAALIDLIDTYYKADVTHQARVFDVSRVRPAGTRLKTFGGSASGPAPLARMLTNTSDILNGVFDTPGRKLHGIAAMDIDHEIASAVVAGGTRRSARMAIMAWNDPQIHEFLACKADPSKNWTTNISVEVTNDFFTEVANGGEHANVVLQLLAKGALENGEPGIWNSSYSNQGEPNPVLATNPCGEICLMAAEPCVLGHVNLGAYVNEAGELDRVGLMEAHRLMTRFLIRATYGDVDDEKQMAVLTHNRRIGVGHFGFAAMVAKLGIGYKQSATSPYVAELLQELAELVEEEVDCYAHDLRIPKCVKSRTVAPTGTIAKMPGTTEGIHPIFSKFFIRRIRLSTVDPDQAAKLEEYRKAGFHVEPCVYAANTAVISIPTQDSLFAEVAAMYGEEKARDLVQAAHELTLEEMLSVQQLYQAYWADNAVSFTANINPDNYTVDQVAETLKQFGPILKGSTIFPDMSRPQSPYEAISQMEYEASTVRAVADGVDEDCAQGACPVR